jgi:hypothetical protein
MRDSAIDLPAILASVYEEGGYDLLIDYRQPPPPPEIAPAEAQWLDRYLLDQELRKAQD